MNKTIRVPIRVYVTLSSEAQEAWMLNYGVDESELKEDVKRYFGNAVSGDDFKDIIGIPLKVEWK